MRKLVTRALLMAPVAAVAVVAAVVSAVPATAAVSWANLPAPVPVAGTAQCHIQPDCVAVLLYGALGSGVEQALTVTSGHGSTGVVPVRGYPASSTDPGQDWTLVSYGRVSDYAATGGFGLTAFDFRNYPAGELFALEFTPGGIPTGYCAANVSEKMALRTCNGSVFQTFMTQGAVGANVRGSRPGGVLAGYLLSVVQERNIWHHNAATGSLLPNVQVTFGGVKQILTQIWIFYN